MEKVINASTVAQKIFQPSNNETSNDPRAILPPDHPLLAKFQRALKEHLLKVILSTIFCSVCVLRRKSFLYSIYKEVGSSN